MIINQQQQQNNILGFFSTTTKKKPKNHSTGGDAWLVCVGVREIYTNQSSISQLTNQPSDYISTSTSKYIYIYIYNPSTDET